MACCELVGLTSNKKKKTEVKRKNEKQLTKEQMFVWMPEHEQAFEVLKEALVTAPVLGYSDFNREFVLEPMLLCKV